MDPVAALALACNISQLIKQAVDAVKACKELYEQGGLDQNNTIEEYAESVSVANKELEVALRGQRSASSSPRPTRLGKVAEDASSTTKELKTVLEHLRVSKKQGKSRLGGAFKATLKTFFKRGTISNLHRKLELQDAALQSGILKDL